MLLQSIGRAPQHSDALMVGSSDFLQQILVTDEFILPISVTRGETATETTATQVKPADIVAVCVKRHRRSDLKPAVATRTLSFFERGICQILVAIANRMLLVTSDAFSHCRPYIIVEQ